jgi:hypothetical protein
VGTAHVSCTQLDACGYVQFLGKILFVTRKVGATAIQRRDWFVLRPFPLFGNDHPVFVNGKDTWRVETLKRNLQTD